MSKRKYLRHRPVRRSVSFAQKYNEKDLNKRCFIQQGNVCSLPYEDGFFNAITAFETVYFWSPVNIALSEVARVLREGGCFLISLEASDPELGKMWTERIDGMVVYTPAELEERLHEAGFHPSEQSVKGRNTYYSI